jgi:DNA primase
VYDLEPQIADILGEGRGHSINRMYHCPLHEDRRPSFCINLEEGLWYCFSCGDKGNYEQLCRRLGEPVDGSYRINRALRDAAREPEDRVDFTSLADKYFDAGRREKPYRLDHFLRGRFIAGDAVGKFHLGWDEARECISFPYPDVDGRVRGIKYRHRNDNKTAEDKSIFEIYQPQLAVGRADVWIFEGESDTIKGWAEIDDDLQGVCGTSGAGLSEAQWVRYSTTFLFSQRIYLCYDADEQGDKCSEIAMRVLGDKCHRVRPTKGKDITEHLLAGGTLKELL